MKRGYLLCIALETQGERLGNASRVRSSSVGPSPPMRMRMSVRLSAFRMTPTRSFLRSPTMVLNATVTPMLVEFFSEVERVGVLAVGREHLGADSDDFRFHGEQPLAFGLCISRVVMKTDVSIRLIVDSMQTERRELKGSHSFHSQFHIINCIAVGEDGGAEGREGNADKVDAGDNERGFAGGRDAHQAAAAVEAGGDVDVAILGEGESLRPTKAAIPCDALHREC